MLGPARVEPFDIQRVDFDSLFQLLDRPREVLRLEQTAAPTPRPGRPGELEGVPEHPFLRIDRATQGVVLLRAGAADFGAQFEHSQQGVVIVQRGAAVVAHVLAAFADPEFFPAAFDGAGDMAFLQVLEGVAVVLQPREKLRPGVGVVEPCDLLHLVELFTQRGLVDRDRVADHPVDRDASLVDPLVEMPQVPLFLRRLVGFELVVDRALGNLVLPVVVEVVEPVGVGVVPERASRDWSLSASSATRTSTWRQQALGGLLLVLFQIDDRPGLFQLAGKRARQARTIVSRQLSSGVSIPRVFVNIDRSKGAFQAHLICEGLPSRRETPSIFSPSAGTHCFCFTSSRDHAHMRTSVDGCREYLHYPDARQINFGKVSKSK